MKKDHVLLISPLPPPDHGTSIPGKLLVDYIRQHCDVELFIVNTQSGDKSGIPLYSPLAVIPFIQISVQIIKKGLLCNKFIIIGSQRFMVTVGIFYTIFFSIFRKQVYLYIHGGAFDIYYKSLNSLSRLFIRRSLNFANTISVQTKLVHSSLSGDFNHLSVIPNWCNIFELFKTQDNIVKNKQRVVRFVYVGEVQQEKGIIELINAYQNARKELESNSIYISLDIFGPTKSDFNDTFYGLLNRCDNFLKYHGYVEHKQLLQQIGSFDVLVLPTYFSSEGYPGVIIEAMAVGLPIITTRWRAIPEIITHEENGLLCEPKNIESLSGCLIRIARDNQLRNRMGSNAKKKASQFDTNVVLARLCSLYGLKPRTKINSKIAVKEV